MVHFVTCCPRVVLQTFKKCFAFLAIFFFFCLIHLIVVFILFQHEFGDHRNMSMLVETPAGKKLFAFDKVMENSLYYHEQLNNGDSLNFTFKMFSS